MSRKIVGLDIGSHSVKVVLARERLGRVDLLQFYERPVNGSAVQELIRSIFQEGHINPDIVVSSVPGNAVSVHYLRIPFSDETKISQVVPYEVEGLIPFPLEDMVIDQFILSKTNGTGPNNGTSVCVALIKKDILQGYIDTLKGVYIDPKIIEIESLAIYHTFREWYRTEDTMALLDIGASRSNLCIVSKGRPVFVRTFGRGGNGITSAIQEAIGISFEEAERKKIATGIILDDETDLATKKSPPPIPSPDTRSWGEGKGGEGEGGGGQLGEKEVISSVIKKGLAPLIVELQQSLHSYEIQHNDPVTKLYMAGGGARLLNIEGHLNRELGMEVEPLSVPEDIMQRLPAGSGVNLLLSTGMGLVLRAARKKHSMGLNFRKGEYFQRKEIKETTGRFLYLIIAFIIIILLGSIDFYFRYHFREMRYEAAKSDIRKAYIEIFPDARNIVNETQQLKSAVDEIEKRVTALGGGADKGVTSLELLNTVTEKIPKDIQVNIDDLLIDKSRIRIQGDTDSFENVERIKRELENIPHFKKVDVGDAKLAADQKRVKFRIIVDME